MKTHLDPILSFNDVTVKYGPSTAVSGVNMNINKNTITALIGPSGCGKSTLLRSVNRMNDVIPIFSLAGRVLFRGENIYDPIVDAVELRRDIGMVFQKPNPFPMSIYRNITWAPKIHGYEGDLNELVEASLKRAYLWEETKDKLHSSGLALSGGQQQRLCIARTIAMNPDVILMDEPCSALDPISTAKIEELITELKQKFTIIIVTHNMQQAARVSDKTAFMYQGKLVEFGPTKEIFNAPRDPLTSDYVRGRFG